MNRPISALHVCGCAFALLAACGGGDAEPDAGPPAPDGPLPAGTFSLTWSITDAAGPVDCDDVGATQVVLTFFPSNASPGFVESFTCASGMATTALHTAQTYDIDITLKNASGQPLDMLDTRIQDLALVAGTNTPIPAVAFTVSRLGNLSFKLDVPGASGNNCADEASSGANLTGVRVELRDAANACVPTAFAVAAGAFDPAQTIAAACPAVISPCIENDQLISATAVTAGSYRLVLTGYEADSTDVACYDSETLLTLSGGGSETNLNTVGLPIDADNAACVTP